MEWRRRRSMFRIVFVEGTEREEGVEGLLGEEMRGRGNLMRRK